MIKCSRDLPVTFLVLISSCCPINSLTFDNKFYRTLQDHQRLHIHSLYNRCIKWPKFHNFSAHQCNKRPSEVPPPVSACGVILVVCSIAVVNASNNLPGFVKNGLPDKFQSIRYFKSCFQAFPPLSA